MVEVTHYFIYCLILYFPNIRICFYHYYPWDIIWNFQIIPVLETSSDRHN